MASLWYLHLYLLTLHSTDARPYTLQPSTIYGRPDPPQSGRDYTAYVKGKLSKLLGFVHLPYQGHDIISGNGKVSVWYTSFELYRNDSINVCAARFIPCPLKAGEVNLHYTATIPDIAPIGGPYNVRIL